MKLKLKNLLVVAMTLLVALPALPVTQIAKAAPQDNKVPIIELTASTTDWTIKDVIITAEVEAVSSTLEIQNPEDRVPKLLGNFSLRLHRDYYPSSSSFGMWYNPESNYYKLYFDPGHPNPSIDINTNIVKDESYGKVHVSRYSYVVVKEVASGQYVTYTIEMYLKPEPPKEIKSKISVKKWAKGIQEKSYFDVNGTVLIDDTFTINENGIYTVYAKDTAGYEAIETISITNIDRTPPAEATFSMSEINSTSRDVVVTIHYPEADALNEYKINDEDWQVYESPIVFSENGTIQARATDAAGNVSPVSSMEVNNINRDSSSYEADLKRAIQRVELAERYKREPYLANAQSIIDLLPNNSPEKAELQARLDTVLLELEGIEDAKSNIPDIDYTPGDDIEDAASSIKDNVAKTSLLAWAKAVTRGEKYFSKGNTTYAITQMEKVPADVMTNPSYKLLVDELTLRTFALKDTWNASVLDRQLQLTISEVYVRVEAYERIRSEQTLAITQQAIDALPEGIVRDAFQARIDRVLSGETPEVPGDEDSGSTEPVEVDPVLVANAEAALQLAERYGSNFYKTRARAAIDQLPQGDVRDAFEARYAKLK